jgi:rfaE bifunctional protein nucleotidyltransferase chain/domain
MTRIVVLGDALLDIDVVGTVRRLCPDAPAPVLDDVVERVRPGGAALAAHLLALDGHDVVLVAPLADDDDAARLRAALHASVEVLAVPHDGGTPVKKRMCAGERVLLRVDTGAIGDIGALPDCTVDALASAGAVLVADYGRGLAEQAGVRAAVAGLNRSVPVVWDPHPRGARPVAGVRLVTPNIDEALGWASRLGVETPSDDPGDRLAGACRVAPGLATAWEAGAVAVTVGDLGAVVSYASGVPAVMPADEIRHADTCGAGDRFASAAAAALADGAVTSEAVQEAVHAAGTFVAAGGAAGLADPASRPPDHQPPDHQPSGHQRPDHQRPDAVVRDVRRAGGTVVATGGCFDLLHAGHVETLRAARRLGDCLVVCLNSDESVRRLKGAGRPVVDQVDRRRLLEALSDVDAVVVFDEDTPERVLRELRPDVWAKGGDYAGTDLPEAPVVASWGGTVVVLPYLQGRSTTQLVRAVGAGPPAPAEPSMQGAS